MTNITSMDNRISSNAFIRLFFVILFNVINIIVSKLILLLAIYQFLCHLLTGKATKRGIRWGEAMSQWTYQMLLFMTYRSERMPFPFHMLGTLEVED